MFAVTALNFDALILLPMQNVARMALLLTRIHDEGKRQGIDEEAQMNQTSYQGHERRQRIRQRLLQRHPVHHKSRRRL
jgi:hypothetical protein